MQLTCLLEVCLYTAVALVPKVSCVNGLLYQYGLNKDREEEAQNHLRKLVQLQMEVYKKKRM